MLIDDETIDQIARHINNRINSPPLINVSSSEGNSFTPQYFEIAPFNDIDNVNTRFYAIDGSYNCQDFYNGVSVALYAAGYSCFESGCEINFSGDIVNKSKKYSNKNILITSEFDKSAIFDELLSLEPVRHFLSFLAIPLDNVFGWGANIASVKESVTASTSKLLGFCQEVLEWALVYEIASSKDIKKWDFILRDGTLRSNNITQECILKLARYVASKNIHLVGITKESPLKMELSSSFRQIDHFLESDLKRIYPFIEADPRRQKLCCWFEIPEIALIKAYPESDQKKRFNKGEIDKITSCSMYAIQGFKLKGRGCGIFHAARLDYVEKLQNYDWVIADLNIFDVLYHAGNEHLPLSQIERNFDNVAKIFRELTRLTQEHYILGYPYPLVEIHNQISLRQDFKEYMIARLKASLCKNQRLDNIEIENLFLDIHSRF